MGVVLDARRHEMSVCFRESLFAMVDARLEEENLPKGGATQSWLPPDVPPFDDLRILASAALLTPEVSRLIAWSASYSKPSFLGRMATAAVLPSDMLSRNRSLVLLILSYAENSPNPAM